MTQNSHPRKDNWHRDCLIRWTPFRDHEGGDRSETRLFEGEAEQTTRDNRNPPHNKAVDAPEEGSALMIGPFSDAMVYAARPIHPMHRIGAANVPELRD